MSVWSERECWSERERECEGEKPMCIGECVRAKEWELVNVAARESFGARECVGARECWNERADVRARSCGRDA